MLNIGRPGSSINPCPDIAIDVTHPTPRLQNTGQAMKVLQGVIACAVLMAASAAPATVKIGEKAPPFELTLIDGTRMRGTDLGGQVVILNFWAT